ncbi:MAG TPA: zinc-ribbon domain-containing protein [Longimicrobiaceae bacterium]|nr:zinc-ribbon domain-containing protein [Longimicrobiaceae bacterium]
MALIHCPDCGAQVSDSAVVCPQCGFPIRRDVLARVTAGGTGSPGSSSSNKLGIILGVVVIGFFVVVVVGGILAAIAIPRFTQASSRAKEQEGEGLLKLVYTLENTYYANNGVYAESFEELKTVGWQEPDSLRYYTVEVASTGAGNLCINALPRPGTTVRPIRIIDSGEIQPGLRCGEANTFSGDIDGNALGVLRDVTSAVAAWRREHGRLPATQAELVEAYPSAADDPDYRMGLTQGGSGDFCMFIAQRMPPTAQPLFSLDGAGHVYRGNGCTGAPMTS